MANVDPMYPLHTFGTKKAKDRNIAIADASGVKDVQKAWSYEIHGAAPKVWVNESKGALDGLV